MYQILKYSFYLLFFLTPLIFTPLNHELFEYNKMMFVYLLTVIIAAVWLLRMLNAKTIIFGRTPLDIPILLFYISQVVSTYFSIDQHTSIWGYYSRSNGGLLSITAYLVLYYALVSNFSKDNVLSFLKSAIFGGLIVALYAIPEHFGVSPSCVFLTGQFDANCWVQDVQARVFATLGQPNWLAAYLAMLIFPAIYFFLKSETLVSKANWLLLVISYYLAFTFTYSRGGLLGLLAGLGVLLLFILYIYFWGAGKRGAPLSARNEMRTSNGAANLQDPKKSILYPIKLLLLSVIFILINLIFASALSSFKLFNLEKITERPSVTGAIVQSGTQLENGGTESGKIRLIVWQGAIDIFKKYPLFGSGVETFAYSYYNFRPLAHNLVSEWDFLYNKAHNEYLNYLATTGLFGLGAYLLMILSFITICLKYLTANYKNQPTSNYRLLTICILASYISYLVQNFFGFSVVIVALFFYLFPALQFLYIGRVNLIDTSSNLFVTKILNNNPLSKILIFITVITAGILIINIHQLWLADTYFKQGSDYSDSGNPGRAYNLLTKAVTLNKNEPLYRSDLSFAAGGASVALLQQESSDEAVLSENASASAQLKDQAVSETEKILNKHPANLTLLRNAVRTYYQLSAIDPKFTQKTLEILDRTITLAPTDPKLHYNKALILYQDNKIDEATDSIKKAIELKPNYRDAMIILADYLIESKKNDEAKEVLNRILTLIPNDPEALERLEKIK